MSLLNKKLKPFGTRVKKLSQKVSQPRRFFLFEGRRITQLRLLQDLCFKSFHVFFPITFCLIILILNFIGILKLRNRRLLFLSFIETHVQLFYIAQKLPTWNVFHGTHKNPTFLNVQKRKIELSWVLKFNFVVLETYTNAKYSLKSFSYFMDRSQKVGVQRPCIAANYCTKEVT